VIRVFRGPKKYVREGTKEHLERGPATGPWEPGVVLELKRPSRNSVNKARTKSSLIATERWRKHEEKSGGASFFGGWGIGSGPKGGVLQKAV